MVVLSKVTAGLACFSAIAAALPTERSTNDFSVDQVTRPRITAKPGFAVQYAKALRKYSIAVPYNVAAAAKKSNANANVNAAGGGGQGSSGTTPVESDSEYITPVNVGGTQMNLDIDTGSADL